MIVAPKYRFCFTLNAPTNVDGHRMPFLKNKQKNKTKNVTFFQLREIGYTRKICVKTLAMCGVLFVNIYYKKNDDKT